MNKDFNKKDFSSSENPENFWVKIKRFFQSPIVKMLIVSIPGVVAVFFGCRPNYSPLSEFSQKALPTAAAYRSDLNENLPDIGYAASVRHAQALAKEEEDLCTLGTDHAMVGGAPGIFSRKSEGEEVKEITEKRAKAAQLAAKGPQHLHDANVKQKRKQEAQQILNQASAAKTGPHTIQTRKEVMISGSLSGVGAQTRIVVERATKTPPSPGETEIRKASEVLGAEKNDDIDRSLLSATEALAKALDELK